MIDPELQSISDLLKEESQFVVPEYQRPYSWTNSEVGELIEDVWSYVGREQGLYLGTVILDVSGRKRKKIAIVDGQQRLTTIFILLIACRVQARSLGDLKRANAIQQKVTFTDELDNTAVGMRLLASPSVRALFEYMADWDWAGDFPPELGRIAVRRLRPVYEAFTSKLKALDQAKLHSLQVALYSTQVMRINIDSPDEAFSIFERTNARGMDLEVADLLKNFLYQKKVKTIREDWSGVVKNASHTMLRMLKFFYMAYRGPVQKAGLYKALKTFADELGSPELFLSRLISFSTFYAYLRNLSTNSEETKNYFDSLGMTAISKHQDRFVEIHESLLALKQFNLVQTQPVVFAAMLCIDRMKLQKDSEAAKAFARLLKAMENYHFINTYVCSHIGNEVEGLYSDSCTCFTKAAKFGMPVDKLITELRRRLAPINEFIENFVQIGYQHKATGKLSYIFDRLNNFGRKVGERRHIFYPDPTMFRHHYNIEHIDPQTPKGELKPTVTVELRQNIGNLTVLTTQLNSELGNKTAEEKFILMKGKLAHRIGELPELVAMVKEFGLDDFVWDDTVIKRRAQSLAERSYTQIWKF